MSYIYNLQDDNLVEIEIVLATGKMPYKKDGWQFDWNKQVKEKNSSTYVLRLKDTQEIQGILQLKIENEMLVMNVIEIAPDNIGSVNKKFDFVAGCLIAFACRESFKIESAYKGFVAFTSKTNLINWYKTKYGATHALGQKMYIAPEQGQKLIKHYLK